MGVKLPAFEFVLFYLFPHLTLEGKRDFSSRFGFLFIINSRNFPREFKTPCLDKIVKLVKPVNKVTKITRKF